MFAVQVSAHAIDSLSDVPLSTLPVLRPNTVCGAGGINGVFQDDLINHSCDSSCTVVHYSPSAVALPQYVIWDKELHHFVFYYGIMLMESSLL